jgi:hypothetical protein
MLTVMGRGSAGGGGGTVTWNPSDKHANIALSGGNLTAGKSGGAGAWHSVRSNNTHTEGFFYMEARATVKDASGGHLFGLMVPGDTLANYPGTGALAFGWYFTNATRQCYQNGALISGGTGGAGVSAGGYAGLAVRINVSTGLIRVWARTSNVAGWLRGGDPSLETLPTHSWSVTPGTAIYAALGLLGITDSDDVNFGDSAFNMAIPTGALPWKSAWVAPTFADPFWEKTVLLLPFEGADTSTSVTDLTGRHTAFTWNNQAQIDTGNSHFPLGALMLDGVSDSVFITDNNADWNFGVSSGTAGDFTLECYAEERTFVQLMALISQYTGAGGGFLFGIDSGGVGLHMRQGDSPVNQRTGSIAANTKDHFAISRSGSVAKMFKGGVQMGADIAWSTAVGASASLTIGADSPSLPNNGELDGWIGWVRVTRAARYTANFTPPTTPYPTV